MPKEISKQDNAGQMTIITVITLSTVLLSIVLAQLFIGYSEYSQSSYDIRSQQVLEIAESAIDNAVYEYTLNPATYSGGTFTSPIGTATVTVNVNNAPSPPQVTLTSSATSGGITRSETALFSVSPPQPILDKVAFAENNLYANSATINGEIFSDNDFSIQSSTVNGDLYAAGKGNGQNDTLTSATVNTYQGSGGNVSVLDPTYLQTHSTVNGNVTYSNTLSVDGTSTVKGTKTHNTSNFLSAISDPTFNFSQAQTTAQQNGTYYDNPTDFMNYVYALCTSKPGSCVTKNGTTTYTVPSGLYYIDCQTIIGFCFLPFLYNTTDNNGNNEVIAGSGVSLIINTWFVDLGGINISSPYQNGSSYYPVMATNGDNDMIQGISTPGITVNMNGLVFADGSINAYGTATNTTTITGAAWASNQLNLFNASTLTYNSTYVQTIAGFSFPAASIHVLTWQENQ